MEWMDILTLPSKDVSFVSSVDDIPHLTAFDALFDKVVNQSLSIAPQTLFTSSLPGDVNDDGEFQSRCGNLTRNDFNSYIHKLTLDSTFTAPSYLNTSILSHLTTRPSATANGGSIHHNLQRLRYERRKQHESTLNYTGFMNGKSDIVDEAVEIMNNLMTQKKSKECVGNVTTPLTVEKDPLPEDTAQVEPDIPDISETERVSLGSDSKESPSPSHGLDECQSTVVSRGKRSARQTPKMAQLMQETSKLPRLEKAFKVTVELSDWIIKPLPDCRGVCVEGKRAGMLDFWHSTAITDIKYPRHVMTASGSEYQLKGPINGLCTVDSGFTASVAKAFKNGFPKNWKQVIKRFYATLEDSIPVEEEISFVNNYGIMKFAVKQECQKKNKFNKASKILPKEVKQSKKFTSKTSNTTPKLKSFSSEEDLDSVLTPVGLIKKSLATTSLTVTRSGRLSLPPLARWSGQKYVLKNSEIMVDFRTSDARRAVMEETRAVYKLSKPHRKMMECQKGVGLSPTVDGRPRSVGSEKSKKIESLAEHKPAKDKMIITNKRSSKISKELASGALEKIGRKGIEKSESLPKNVIQFHHHKGKSSKRASRQSLDSTASSKGKQKERRSSGRLKMKKCSIVLEKRDFTPHTVSQLCKDKDKNSRKEQSMTEITNTKHINQKSSKAVKGMEHKKASCKENAHCQERKSKRQRKTIKKTNKDHMLETKEEKSVGKKRMRSPSRSPPFNNNYGSESKGYKIENSTPRSTNRNHLKKRRITSVDTTEGSWSVHEKDCLQRAVRNVNNSSSDFWDEVARAVQTKTAEECQLFYTDYLEDKTGEKLNKSKGKSCHSSGRQKGDPVQGKRGTMKRKKEIRAFLDEQNEGYEDNLFDGTPFARRKPTSSLVNKITFDKADDEIFGANCNFFTPVPGRDKLLSPQSCLRVPFASAKKTPALMNNFISSPLSVQRHCADKYIHTFMDKKKRSLTGAGTSAMNLDADLESSLLPKKSLFSPAGKASVFLADDKELDDLQEDDEDNRYMYYWNDLDCSQ